MAQAQGINTYLQYQKETTFATDPVTPNGRKLYFSSEDINLTRPTEGWDMYGVPYDGSNVSGRDSHRVAAGRVDVSGSIKTHLQAFQLGNLFYGAMGRVTTTNNSGIYTHDIEMGQTLPSYVFEIAHPDLSLYKHINGAMINKLTVNFKQSGFDEVTVDLMGVSCVYNATVWDSSMVDNGYAPFSSESSTNEISIAGSTVAYITELNLILDNQLDGEAHVIGGGVGAPRKWIYPGICKVSGSLTALFINATLYNLALNHTATQIYMIRGRGVGDGSLGNEQIRFLLQSCRLSPKSPVVKGAKGLLVELDFDAVEVTTSDPSTSILVTLVNTESSITG